MQVLLSKFRNINSLLGFGHVFITKTAVKPEWSDLMKKWFTGWWNAIWSEQKIQTTYAQYVLNLAQLGTRKGINWLKWPALVLRYYLWMEIWKTLKAWIRSNTDFVGLKGAVIKYLWGQGKCFPGIGASRVWIQVYTENEKKIVHFKWIQIFVCVWDICWPTHNLNQMVTP